MTLLVIGDGPFGILIARLAAQRRLGRLILLGRHDFRLRHVPEAITINEKNTPDPLRAILEHNAGQGVDAVIMATGSSDALELGIATLRARGRLVQFSAVHGSPRLDWFRLHTQELEILGACNDQELIDPALACLADPSFRLHTLVTHQLPFSQWQRGFELARGGKDEALKVALVFEEMT
jgi:threonine dehydrogenase-like Zn-dependent dehydrogenase